MDKPPKQKMVEMDRKQRLQEDAYDIPWHWVVEGNGLLIGLLIWARK